MVDKTQNKTKKEMAKEVWSKCGRRLSTSIPGLNQDQINSIRDSFNKIDKNSDGRISVTELMKAQQALGLSATRKEVKQMIKEVDKNKTGFIELHEYMKVMTERLGALDYKTNHTKQPATSDSHSIVGTGDTGRGK